jgi:hypothetical protein
VFRLELIAEHHNVLPFDCRSTVLNLFLKEKALAETNSEISRTFVLLDVSLTSPFVVGYFTLRADSYYTDAIPGIDIIPVVELAYLARDITRYGEGLGDYLLIEAFRNVKEAADLIGIAGLHLSYTIEGKKLYDRYDFVEHPVPYRTDLLFLPIKVLRQIISAMEEEE